MLAAKSVACRLTLNSHFKVHIVPLVSVADAVYAKQVSVVEKQSPFIPALALR
jgi:hypothetical protein